MKLSVQMITFNHEPFIAQALEGALAQQVDFDYEIVVGEDCSTDATRRILLEYRERFPDKLRLLLPEKNLGMMRNFKQTLEACRGEYIALLEGDDYWTSPQKLQKQVDFLDAHPECCATFHNVTIVGEPDAPAGRPFHAKPLKQFYNQRDIVSDFFIPTCSTVFRRGLFGDLPEWVLALPMGDWPLHILNSGYGSYGYLDEVMAAYRVHMGGVWTQKKKLGQLQSTVAAMKTVNRELDYKYDSLIRRKIALMECESAAAMMEERDFRAASSHAARALAAAPRAPKVYRKVLKLAAAGVARLVSKR